MMRHMMIDLETFGVGSRAAVVQVVAVVFDPYNETPGQENPGHEWNVDLNDVIKLGGTLDAKTLMWWMMQPDKARHSLVRRGHVPMSVVLLQMIDLYKSHRCHAVWCQGLSFDIPILQHYFDRLGLETPWQYNDTQDTRTLYATLRHLGVPAYRPSLDQPTAHTALADARAQVMDVQAALGSLRYVHEVAKASTTVA